MSSPDRDTVMAVLDRDGYRCVLCGAAIEGERGMTWAVHHRRYRDGRPDEHTPQNLITVCGGSNVDRCHGLIHSGKKFAMKRGWSISRLGSQDPLVIPVFIEHQCRLVYLTADGKYSDHPPDTEERTEALARTVECPQPQCGAKPGHGCSEPGEKQRAGWQFSHLGRLKLARGET